jgi:hypothetical protein
VFLTGIGFLVYHFLPFKIPKEWEDAAVVTFLCTVAIGFIFHEFWKRFSFWVSLAIAALAQLWVIKVLNPTAHWHYHNASILTGFCCWVLCMGSNVLTASSGLSEFRYPLRLIVMSSNETRQLPLSGDYTHRRGSHRREAQQHETSNSRTFLCRPRDRSGRLDSDHHTHLGRNNH